MYKWIGTLALMCVLPFFAFADEASDIENIRAKLKESFPDFTPDAIGVSPIEGMYEVAFGTQIVYITNDGRHVIQGTLIDIDDGKKDLTAASAAKIRKQYMSAVNEFESIEFGPEKPRHVVTVFTDIDCVYCQKLHAEIDQYSSYGIQVNYLFFPRSGLTSTGYLKAISVWCSDDREKALTLAKSGKEIEEKTCENPIAEHYQMGQKVGVTGTPALLTEDGVLMAGYLPAKQLAQRLDEEAKKN